MTIQFDSLLLPYFPSEDGRWPSISSVLPAVLPGGSTVLPLPRSFAIFRLSWEGTDPALRGRRGRRPSAPAVGVAA